MSSFKFILKQTYKKSFLTILDNYFANIIGSIAVSMDGVGTKILLAQILNKYNTIGIDCVAMNVNDLICIGAEPIAMLDYIAVQEFHEEIMNDIAKGLAKGAKLANISIPGGETAQISDMLQGIKQGYGLDLAGAGIGLINSNKVILGDCLEGELPSLFFEQLRASEVTLKGN